MMWHCYHMALWAYIQTLHSLQRPFSTKARIPIQLSYVAYKILNISNSMAFVFCNLMAILTFNSSILTIASQNLFSKATMSLDPFFLLIKCTTTSWYIGSSIIGELWRKWTSIILSNIIFILQTNLLLLHSFRGDLTSKLVREPGVGSKEWGGGIIVRNSKIEKFH